MECLINTRVLVVDDNSGSLQLLRMALEADGFSIVEASDGQQALKVLKEQPIDCVISDILMPVMDGYRLCYEIKKTPAFRDLHIILFSATYGSNAKETSLSFGADRFVNKQTEIVEIAAIVREVMRTKPKPLRSDKNLPPESDVMKKYNQTLIEKLEQRTADLEKQAEQLLRLNAEMQSFNRVTVGREERMVELKREVNELCRDLGKPPRYDLSIFEKKKGS